jgi:hypothetical protein
MLNLRIDRLAWLGSRCEFAGFTGLVFMIVAELRDFAAAVMKSLRRHSVVDFFAVEQLTSGEGSD